jgi:hypothetical protein
MEAEYPNNPYHNSIHAADVLHSFNYLVFQTPSICSKLTDLEKFAAIVAAIGHDIDHPVRQHASIYFLLFSTAEKSPNVHFC